MIHEVATLTKTEQLCEYEVMPSGINHIRLLKNSRAGADTFFEVLAKPLVGKTPNDSLVRYLIELPNGMANFQYSMNKAQVFDRQYKNRPPTRTAYLLNDQFQAMLIDSLLRLLRLGRDRNRFFSNKQRDEAMAWLMSD
jgi:hypothetical protein